MAASREETFEFRITVSFRGFAESIEQLNEIIGQVSSRPLILHHKHYIKTWRRRLVETSNVDEVDLLIDPALTRATAYRTALNKAGVSADGRVSIYISHAYQSGEVRLLPHQLDAMSEADLELAIAVYTMPGRDV
jgi:hypothetical protein